MRAPLDMGAFRVTNAVPAAAANDLVTLAQVQALLAAVSVLPVGSVVAWSSGSDLQPGGWLFCNGQAVSRTTYAALFTILGTFYGPGDGFSTFNLPDYRGRALIGRTTMGGSSSSILSDYPAAAGIGANIGAQNHVLTQTQMPSHNHTINDPGHNHSYERTTLTGQSQLDGGNNQYSQQSVSTSVATTGVTINATGNNAAHPNVQPSTTVTVLIYAGA